MFCNKSIFMKIRLAQLNYVVGDVDYNVKKIIEVIFDAKQHSVDLVVFSELCICGYSPLDLLEYKSFILKCKEGLDKIVSESEGIAVIVGLPTLNTNYRGKNLYNSAVFINDGQVQKIINKTLLPTYDVFDEYRYFESNDVFDIIEFKGEKIALTICEDLWDEQMTYGIFDREMLYKTAPMDKLIKLNPDFIINIAGSPFSYNQAQNRRDILIKNVIKYSLPIVYVNQVGANTELIFDGGSCVIGRGGYLAAKCKYFKEEILDFDLEKENNEFHDSIIHDKYCLIYNALIVGIKDFFAKQGFKKAVLGLSGGIDSAVTMALAVKALGSENVVALLMPSIYSSEHSIIDSVEMAEKCGVKYEIINIEQIRLGFEETFSSIFKGTQKDITEENIQARIRGIILMAYSNKFGHIVLNTSNKSEFAVGYSTMYGDMNGALSVLGDVYKTDVYKLAEYINEKYGNLIPKNIIIKAPSAELRPDQKDSDSLPEYDILDKILFSYIELRQCPELIAKSGLEIKTINEVVRMVNKSEFKRFQAPPILRISSKAFGFGRRIPIVAKF